MKPMRTLSPLLLAVLAVTVFTSSIPAEARDSSKTVIEGNTAFAFDLYDKLKEKDGNLFFSPYSISTALAMTYAGARGNTEKQMAEGLHFTLNQKRLHPAFARLEATLNAVQKKEGIELSIANALWAQKDYHFLREFLDLTKKNYGAVLNHVNFKEACEPTRRKINAWVEQKTKNKIKDLIKPGVLDPLTRLVLTNAIYFKSYWASQFKKSWTKPRLFWLTPGKSINVPMMSQKEKFKYAERDGLKILELPYIGNHLSMIVLLPEKVDGLAQLEGMLSKKKLNAWVGRLREKKVFVILPKFKMSSQFRLDKTLALMGMPDAFSRQADFSGMDGTRMLYISAIIHKAYVDVNEEGTEAAAATGGVMGITAVAPAPPRPTIFRADHPFVFLIRHNTSGSILLLGRVVDPTK